MYLLILIQKRCTYLFGFKNDVLTYSEPGVNISYVFDACFLEKVDVSLFLFSDNNFYRYDTTQDCIKGFLVIRGVYDIIYQWRLYENKLVLEQVSYGYITRQGIITPDTQDMWMYDLFVDKCMMQDPRMYSSVSG